MITGNTAQMHITDRRRKKEPSSSAEGWLELPRVGSDCWSFHKVTTESAGMVLALSVVLKFIYRIWISIRYSFVSPTPKFCR